MKTQKIWLPSGFQESINERSRIHAAISNVNQATKYLNGWLKNYKADPTNSNLSSIEFALNWGMKYRDEFEAVEWLANKYNQLWQEKYYKAKHFMELSTNKAEQIFKNHQPISQ